jgi:hypothetical protein
LGEGKFRKILKKFFGHTPTAVSKGNSVNIPKPEGWIEGCSFHLFHFLREGRGGGGRKISLFFSFFWVVGGGFALSGLQKAVTLIDLWDVFRDPGKRSLFLLTLISSLAVGVKTNQTKFSAFWVLF